jgi:5-(carboxyamino)imidazole ribonucleotide synthase
MLGGGQLGRMAALVARRMGYRIVVLDPVQGCPAGQVADAQIVAAYDDPAALDRLAVEAAAVTLEFENLPAASLDRLARHLSVRPSTTVLRVCQDRLAERTFLHELGIATAAYAPVLNAASLADAANMVPFPALLKTTRLGYDSKGQRPVARAEALSEAYHALGDVPCLLEQVVDFTCEISVLVVRDALGRAVTYEPAENSHVHGILDTSMVPAPLPPALVQEACDLAGRIAGALDLVGVLAVELFVTRNDRLLVNELAPRPHNSGHWSIEACQTSQFEQQVRVTAGAPVGEPRLLAPAAIANILGDLWQNGEPSWERVLALPDVHLHLYGKDEPRPGRKMGHLTALASTAAEARGRVLYARSLLEDQGH